MTNPVTSVATSMTCRTENPFPRPTLERFKRFDVRSSQVTVTARPALVPIAARPARED
jgi:hypothetical protein